MHCHGFSFLDAEESEAGEPAREGTAAGELLQFKLEGRAIPAVASNGVYFNPEMEFYMQGLAENIRSQAATQILCETRIDWQTRSGIYVRGQYDASYVDNQGRLCIDDLKYGWGIVEVKNNWQLLGYAIGEVIRRGTYFSHIVFRILQPRPHHEDGYLRTWVITYEQLLEFKEQIEQRMLEIASGVRTLSTSKACKYCPGTKDACPAFSRLYYRSLEVSMDFIQDGISNDELSAMLDQAKRAQEVLKIKYDSLVELGTSRIKKGQMIPGYVQTNTYSNRAWKTGVTPEAVKIITGVDAVEKTFMSPAKLEKAGINKKVIEQLCTSSLIGVKLEKKNSTDIGNKIFGTHNPLVGS